MNDKTHERQTHEQQTHERQTHERQNTHAFVGDGFIRPEITSLYVNTSEYAH
ncbi:MAG: hypothetical protein FWG87_10850 [Defluviitaleaceae bacterium]|nr:hypothetical protein [Defluviitaleaceae bacterium]